MIPLLDTKAITVVFANVEDILLTNTVNDFCDRHFGLPINLLPQTFLSSLEERQKECRLYIDRIGDILHKNMSNMAIYMVPYPLLVIIWLLT